MTIKRILISLLLLLIWIQPCYSSIHKLALVIGNSDYSEAPLTNPIHDARDMAQALRDLGFEVIVRENQSQEGMNAAAREFGDRLGKGMIGLFYYAGHGMQVKGKNYLIPVKSGIQREDEVPYRAFDVNQLLAKMESAHNGLNLVVLDACRNNPFERSFRSGEEGLAPMDAPTGTLIAYAAKPGTKSKDSNADGNNGLYTGTLLKYINTMPYLKIEELLKKVRIDVKKASGEQQATWEEGGLENDFCFSVCGVNPNPPVPAPITTVDNTRIELGFWNSIKDSDNPSDFQAYLQQYPSGKFAALAQNRQARLQTPIAPRVSPQPAPAPFSPPASVCNGCPEMVAIPAGEFWMGATDGDPDTLVDEMPRHRVRVSAFSLGKYEVTQGQWRAVMGNNPSVYKDCGDDCPVENVSYNDVQAFISRLNRQTGRRYRLPTEAEWEYACRAGGYQRYCGADSQDAVAWSADNSGGKPHPVGQKQPNAWGLYDMSGNVWEWLCSTYNPQGYDGKEKICADDKSLRVLRGGSLNFIARNLRSAGRNGSSPVSRFNSWGFRLTQDI